MIARRISLIALAAATSPAAASEPILPPDGVAARAAVEFIRTLDEKSLGAQPNAFERDFRWRRPDGRRWGGEASFRRWAADRLVSIDFQDRGGGIVAHPIMRGDLILVYAPVTLTVRGDAPLRSRASLEVTSSHEMLRLTFRRPALRGARPSPMTFEILR